MNEQMKHADWVLVVCTEEYHRRFEGIVPADSGCGVRWESQHITPAFFDQKYHNKRFVPVLPPEGDKCDMPSALSDYSRYRLGGGGEGEYEAIYGLLTAKTRPPHQRSVRSRRRRSHHCLSLKLAGRAMIIIGGGGHGT